MNDALIALHLGAVSTRMASFKPTQRGIEVLWGKSCLTADVSAATIASNLSPWQTLFPPRCVVIFGKDVAVPYILELDGAIQEDQLKKAVKWAAAAKLKLHPDTIMTSFSVISSPCIANEKWVVFAESAKIADIENTLDIVDSYGMHIVAAYSYVSSITTLAASVAIHDSALAGVVLDLGSSGPSIMVFSQQGPLYTRRLDFKWTRDPDGMITEQEFCMALTRSLDVLDHFRTLPSGRTMQLGVAYLTGLPVRVEDIRAPVGKILDMDCHRLVDRARALRITTFDPSVQSQSLLAGTIGGAMIHFSGEQNEG